MIRTVLPLGAPEHDLRRSAPDTVQPAKED